MGRLKYPPTGLVGVLVGWVTQVWTCFKIWPVDCTSLAPVWKISFKSFYDFISTGGKGLLPSTVDTTSRSWCQIFFALCVKIQCDSVFFKWVEQHTCNVQHIPFDLTSWRHSACRYSIMFMYWYQQKNYDCFWLHIYQGRGHTTELGWAKILHLMDWDLFQAAARWFGAILLYTQYIDRRNHSVLWSVSMPNGLLPLPAWAGTTKILMNMRKAYFSEHNMVRYFGVCVLEDSSIWIFTKWRARWRWGQGWQIPMYAALEFKISKPLQSSKQTTTSIYHCEFCWTPRPDWLNTLYL